MRSSAHFCPSLRAFYSHLPEIVLTVLLFRLPLDKRKGG